MQSVNGAQFLNIAPLFPWSGSSLAFASAAACPPVIAKVPLTRNDAYMDAYNHIKLTVAL